MRESVSFHVAHSTGRQLRATFSLLSEEGGKLARPGRTVNANGTAARGETATFPGTGG
jgi:hypothetical protein